MQYLAFTKTTFKAQLVLFFIAVTFSCYYAYATTKTNHSISKDSIERDILLKWYQKHDSLLLVAKNYTYAPLLVYAKHIAYKDSIKEQVIPPKDSIVFFYVKGIQLEKTRTYYNAKYQFGYYFGDPYSCRPELNYLYRLPFKKGYKYRLSQGYNGKFSHKSTPSKYALDFQLEIDEPVHAAREGIVVKTEDHHTEHGGKAYRYKANRIIILHSDGTTASYVHLKPKGVLVTEGDFVIKGQHIGYSGLTGYTRGPHLHFVVRKERDIAIPVFFEGYEQESLKPGKRYRIQK